MVRGSSTFGGHPGCWHRSQNPFLPAKGMVRVSLQSLCHSPSCPAPPVVPEDPAEENGDVVTFGVTRQMPRLSKAGALKCAFGAWLLAWPAPACLTFSQETHPVSWVSGAAR